MVYANAWSDSNPPGSSPANTIDTIIQTLRSEIHERMNDIVVDWLADPIVLKSTTSGANTAKTLKLAPYGFTSDSTFSIPQPGYYALYPIGFGGFAPTIGNAYINVPLPSGVTITRIRVLADKNSAPNLTVEFRGVRLADGNDGARLFGPITINTAGIVMADTGAMTLNIDDTYLYYLKVIGGSTTQFAKIYGAIITYSCPDSSKAA